ncbi:hypothetical protein EAO68_29290 [Streptomyces sp. wa22]|nr:hypothetical protein EAO68_29290 [Streptomyces sp. wa22]
MSGDEPGDDPAVTSFVQPTGDAQAAQRQALRGELGCRVGESCLDDTLAEPERAATACAVFHAAT